MRDCARCDTANAADCAVDWTVDFRSIDFEWIELCSKDRSALVSCMFLAMEDVSIAFVFFCISDDKEDDNDAEEEAFLSAVEEARVFCPNAGTTPSVSSSSSSICFSAFGGVIEPKTADANTSGFHATGDVLNIVLASAFVVTVVEHIIFIIIAADVKNCIRIMTTYMKMNYRYAGF